MSALGLALIAAVACGSNGSNEPAAAPTIAVPAPTSASLPRIDPTSPTPATAAGSAQLPPSAGDGVLSKEVEGTIFNWRIADVDEGTKPAIAVAPDGTVNVAYMIEAMPGWVKNAQLQTAGWSITTVDEGYFYGPLDVAVGPDGQPRIVWHDHQGNTFRPEAGDAVLGVRNAGGEWSLTVLRDQGHDGWDTRLFIDAGGGVHVSGVDPEEFGGAGVEYYSLGAGDGQPTVESVGSGPQTYRWATSVAVDSSGVPYVTYLDQAEGDLIVASKVAGEWARETVDSDGNSGLFNDIVIGPDDSIHVSYITLSGNTAGTVKYATRDAGGSEWQVTEIAELDSITLGFEGARNLTSIDLGPDGNPWIAFGDGSRTSIAVFDGSTWQVEDIERSGDQGQQVSLAVDQDGRPHIAFFRLEGKGPLRGVIRYAVGTPK